MDTEIPVRYNTNEKNTTKTKTNLPQCAVHSQQHTSDARTTMTSNEQPCYTTTPTPTPATRPATTPTNIDDKVPKTWPPQKYQRLIQAYRDNSGNTRHLPEKTVLGAEKMLVRMWHEHHKSKVYTAVTLREIITNRTFTALGAVNSTVKRDKLDRTLTIDTSNNALVPQELKDWDAQTPMMILDALRAVNWAWVLIQIGTEDEVTAYIDRFKQMSRCNSQRHPNITAMWDTFAWEIAVNVRTSSTFKQITQGLLSDPVLADILPQPLPKCPKGDKGKGQGKGKRQRLLGSTQGIPKDVETYGPSPRPIQQYSQPFPPTPPPPQNQQAFPPTRDKANSITPKDNRRGNAEAHGRASTRDSAARRLQHLR